jgi:hypothetical protein
MASDLGIDTASLALAQAKQHNESTLLISLPSELIGHILRLRLIGPPRSRSTDVHESHAFVNAEDALTVDPTWTRMMLVCSHIRSVALGDPVLWSYIDCAVFTRHWIDICLRRAGAYPLVLINVDIQNNRITYRSKNEDRMIEIMPQARLINLARSSSLEIIDAANCPLPRLQSFTLEISSIVSNRFTTTANSLTRLTLANVGIDTHLSFPLLTHLSLRRTSLFTRELLDLLQLIARSTLLEVIVMDEMDVYDPDLNDFEPHMSIPCAHLRILSFCQSYPVAWYFLRALPDPSNGLHLKLFGNDPIKLPPTNGSAAEQLLCRVQNFWRRTSGSSFMGAGKIEIVSAHHDASRITLGHRFDLDSAPPSLYLEMTAEVIGEDDLLAVITEASYSNISHPERRTDEETEVEAIGDHTERLIIRGPIADDHLLQLEYWMRVRVRHGHSPVNVIFQPPSGHLDDTNTHVRAGRHKQARRLEKEDYVGSVACY